MVDMRRVHAEALPKSDFTFQIENALEPFVWRWITLADESILGWVDRAVKQDRFQVRTEQPDQIPTDEERHSPSVVDIFRSFNQSLDQIISLNWEDDYQFAKFMTAMSQAFGGGVTRYCDLIEQLFVKEMDRLTPEREAMMNKSRQEKWMQMAKDTFSGKEKVEPFQFFPEVSFALAKQSHRLIMNQVICKTQ